eukprot:gene35324-47474_t
MVRKAGNQPKVDEKTVMLQSAISQAFAAIGSQHSLRVINRSPEGKSLIDNYGLELRKTLLDTLHTVLAQKLHTSSSSNPNATSSKGSKK